MDRFTTTALQPTGELVNCADSETKLLSVPDVSLSALPKGSSNVSHVGGVLIVTTHRLAWVSSTRGKAYGISLAQLSRSVPLETVHSLRGKTRGELVFSDGRRVRVEFHGNGGSNRRDSSRQTILNARKAAQWEVDKALLAKKKAKEEAERKRVENERPVLLANAVGIGGAIKNVQERSAARKQVITTGFSSLEDLKHAAEELIAVAKALQYSPAIETESGEKDNTLLQAMKAAGIPSPVTKGSVAGGRDFYREEIARETATFLVRELPKLGGLITVADAYALVMRNRASSELVSPEDFGNATERLKALKVGLSVVKLPGGQKAIEMDCGVGAGGKELVKLAEKNSISAVDLARIRRIPLNRATIMLEDAEKAELLARDYVHGVVRFYPNRFDAFAQGRNNMKT